MSLTPDLEKHSSDTHCILVALRVSRAQLSGAAWARDVVENTNQEIGFLQGVRVSQSMRSFKSFLRLEASG